MVQSMFRGGNIRISSLYLFTVFLIIQLIFSSNNPHVEFEKGIEAVRSKGYLLNGDLKWRESVAGSCQITETSLGEFLKICENQRTTNDPLTVYLDYNEKILFVYSISGKENIPDVYRCRFR